MMKKGIIIYQSKYGAAKKYAQWLQEMTGFDRAEKSKVQGNELSRYDTVVLCGGIYASGIAGLSFFKKHIGMLKNKKTAVFCVGASPCDENALKQVREHNLTGELKEIPLFYGRGAWMESRMTFVDRTLCKMLQKSVAKKDPNTYECWMKALMEAIGQDCDWTDKKYLAPLVDYLQDSIGMERHFFQ